MSLVFGDTHLCYQLKKKENRISLGEVVTPLIKLDKTLKNLSFNSTVLLKMKDYYQRLHLKQEV